MTPIQIVLSIVLIIVAIAIIVLVALQESKQQGLSGAIGGAGNGFFGKNKSRTMEAQLSKFTKIAGTVFFVLSLISAILILFGV